MTSQNSRRSLPKWLRSPEMVVAISAVILSLCGLFIAIYESMLIRRHQQATVWPHLEVQTSLRDDEVTLRVENTGLGPARIEAASVSVDGEALEDWQAMLAAVGITDPVPAYRSYLGGRVLPQQAWETIFQVSEDGGAPAEALDLLHGALEGDRINITVCYCSVYGECWVARLQDLYRRSESSLVVGPRPVPSCSESARSRI